MKCIKKLYGTKLAVLLNETQRLFGVIIVIMLYFPQCEKIVWIVNDTGLGEHASKKSKSVHGFVTGN